MCVRTIKSKFLEDNVCITSNYFYNHKVLYYQDSVKYPFVYSETASFSFWLFSKYTLAYTIIYNLTKEEKSGYSKENGDTVKENTLCL